MIDLHSLKTLEYEKVISLIAGKCLTPFGKNIVNDFKPMFTREEIVKRLSEISEMKDIINFGDAFPLYRLEDSRNLIHKSNIEGAYLDPKEILEILELIEVSMGINGYHKEGRDNFPLLTEYIKEIRAFPEMKTAIRKAIDEDGEIKDTASSALRKIRIELSDNRRNIVNKLEKIIASSKKQSGWQDDVVTQRSGRYVIPVPSSQYRNDSGILHDRSQSGATLFIEPRETVELNNRINILIQEEHFEIERILRNLTMEISTRSEALLKNVDLIGHLDSIHAAASFSNQVKGHQPDIEDEPMFELNNVRHPLLLVQMKDKKAVVPANISIGQERQALLITGPNTGGKTIILKNIGLAVLMAQTGLHISADTNSKVGIFKQDFCRYWR